MSLDRPAAQSKDEPYETEFFAMKYGLPRKLAKTMLETNGPARRACDAAATTYLRCVAFRRERGS